MNWQFCILAALPPLLWRQLQMAQQLAYYPGRYLAWLWSRSTMARYPYVPLALGALLACFWSPAAPLTAGALLLRRRGGQIVPLRPTPRIWRLAGAVLLFVATIVAAAPAPAAPWLALLLLQPVLLAALAVTAPLERQLAKGFVRRAGRQLAECAPVVVGITGSYGKTTTKRMLEHLAGDSLATLATPKSYNTLLGVTRAVNELLRPYHRLFLAEMGARRRGDIAEICRLARPHIGVITAVGAMHLEHFGSLEQVREGKFELAKALPPEGLLVVDLDALGGYRGEIRCRVVTVSATNPGADVRAESIACSAAGTRFRLVHPAGAAMVRIPVVGLAAVHDFLCAAAVAIELGVTLGQVVSRSASLPQGEHRMAVSSVGRVTLIDDTYSANPHGVALALEALGYFPGPRILVTPGIVEQGAEEEAANRRVGAAAAGIVDHLIVVESPCADHIIDGWLAVRGESSLVVRAAGRDEAFRAAYALAEPGGTVLACSDLPDVFH